MDSSFADLVDGIFYINLDHRTDRKEEIEKELRDIGLPFERFSAIPTCPGIIGCGYSHLSVLKEARRRGYKNVLIFEDDFEFLINSTTFHGYMKDFMAEIKSVGVVERNQ